MEKWLVGCGAATSGVYGVFNKKKLPSPLSTIFVRVLALKKKMYGQTCIELVAM
jgi:hypothetical protein